MIISLFYVYLEQRGIEETTSYSLPVVFQLVVEKSSQILGVSLGVFETNKVRLDLLAR